MKVDCINIFHFKGFLYLEVGAVKIPVGYRVDSAVQLEGSDGSRIITVVDKTLPSADGKCTGIICGIVPDRW